MGDKTLHVLAKNIKMVC